MGKKENRHTKVGEAGEDESIQEKININIQ